MLKMYFGLFKTLMANKKGQGMVEYGLLVGLIAIVVIAALVVLGPQIRDLFTTVSTQLTNNAK